jgi:hypothetical protein
MSAYGVAGRFPWWGRASLEHGTDDEPAQDGYQGHLDAVQVGIAGGEGKVRREALGPHRVPAPRQARPPTYDEDVMVGLRTV